MRTDTAILVTLMTIWLFIISIFCIKMQNRIEHIECQIIKLEAECNDLRNQINQVKRINDTNLRLLAEGGWECLK